jgi:Uma2 family endonuclease
MATQPALLSLEEYLRTSYRPDVHFVDGEIEERNLGEYEHARLQWLIGGFFGPHEKEWGIRGVVEQRIRVSPSRVRIADLALLRADAPREKITETPPLVCIEIMSPEDRLSRAKVVLADYFALGVPNIWLLDPLRRVAYSFGSNGLVELDSLKFAVQDSPIHLDVAELFAQLD